MIHVDRVYYRRASAVTGRVRKCIADRLAWRTDDQQPKDQTADRDDNDGLEAAATIEAAADEARTAIEAVEEELAMLGETKQDVLAQSEVQEMSFLKPIPKASSHKVNVLEPYSAFRSSADWSRNAADEAIIAI